MAPLAPKPPHTGPAILSGGFRPFFFFGALHAGAAILLWLAMFEGRAAIDSSFGPRDWHVHEMLFGYVGAVVTGFLLTAIPNWTGRLPLRGGPLLALVITWMAGRIAVAFSQQIGWIAAAAIDSLFLFAVAAAAAREIAASGSLKNLRVVGAVAMIATANLGFHVEAAVDGTAIYSLRGGFAAIVMLIALIGGRIIPSFTLNWLSRRGTGRLPAPFGNFDGVVLAASAAALIGWIARGDGAIVAAALALAGILHAARLARWAGDRTAREPLLLILHIAYGFVPAGFVLLALAAVEVTTASAGLHAWGVGAIGTMTLAVMSRASLGHTGRALIASPALQAVYAAALIAALARICAVLHPAWSEALLYVAAFSWAAAFLGFASLYAPILCLTRLKATSAPS